MRIAVAYATEAARRWVVPLLETVGHDVVAVDRARSPAASAPPPAAQLEGCDALVITATPLPVAPGARSWRWRAHDGASADALRSLVAVARAAGVRRVVQQSFSCLYADHGTQWVTEESPVCVTADTEPASDCELAVQAHASSCRTGVVLRMGQVVGDSALTRWSLRAASWGRPTGLGQAMGYVHLIHSDDVGPAVLAALDVPSGVYNVGAQPVRRGVLADAHAEAVGRGSGSFESPLATRLAGRRLEPLRRSLRVDSARFASTTGWSPRREWFDPSWLEAARSPEVAFR